MHTSTVTVAIIDPITVKEIIFDNKDFRIEWYSGTGCGGQHRNKTKTSCRLTHIPTGLIQTAQTRSRENSYKLAMEALNDLLITANKQSIQADANKIRASQIGSGMRGDKIRTYREQDGMVTDHRSNRRAALRLIELGQLDLLW